MHGSAKPARRHAAEREGGAAVPGAHVHTPRGLLGVPCISAGCRPRLSAAVTVQGLKMCTSTTDADASTEVRQAVVHAMRDMICTLHSRKLLWANSRDREGLNMWDRTFSAATEVSPDLAPEALGVLA